MLVGCAANAQSTSPRFGTTAGDDNTDRVKTNSWVAATDAAGADTVSYNPNKSHAYYRLSLTDSLTFKLSSITRSYAGDEIHIIATGTSGNKLKFTGTNMQTTGTATLSSGACAVIDLVFTGAKWIEQNRVVQ